LYTSNFTPPAAGFTYDNTTQIYRPVPCISANVWDGTAKVVTARPGDAGRNSLTTKTIFTNRTGATQNLKVAVETY
jgi:hypothetical protein